MVWPHLTIVTWWRPQEEELEAVQDGPKGSQWVWLKWGSSPTGSSKDSNSVSWSCIQTSPLYLLALSIVGVAVSILDILETHNNRLPASDWRCLVPETNTRKLRTGKLVSSGLYIVIYTSLFLGVSKSLPDLLVPYLAVQLVTIALATLTIMIVGARNRYALRRVMFCQLVFMIVNWLHCYWHYQAMTAARRSYGIVRSDNTCE